MFDKVPSLKDFIIYFVPGVLITYFGLTILNNYSNGSVAKSTIDKLPANSALSFIGVIISFVIGFIFSQLQIILFLKYLEWKQPGYNTLEESSLKKTFKNLVIQKAKTRFQLQLTDGEISTEKQIFQFCLNYIRAKSNGDSVGAIDRWKNLSSLAVSLILPLLLAMWAFLQILELPVWLLPILLITSAIIIIQLMKMISMSFRKSFRDNVYQHFAVLE